MTKRLGMIVLLASAAPMAAVHAQQADPLAAKVADAMQAQTSGKYRPAQCSADKGKHFKVSAAGTYLKSAIEDAKDPKARERILGDARRNAVEAITGSGQDKAASAWYILGRVALFQGDVVEADTALARALMLAPDCEEEIRLMRRIAYIALANAGMTAMEAKENPTAVLALRRASAVFDGSAYAAYNLGAIFSEAGEVDSAATYFGIAAKSTSKDTAEAKIRSRALFNQGVVYLNANRPADAVRVFESYVAANPADVDAKRGLAQAYRAAGQVEKARAIDAETGISTAAGPAANKALEAALELYREKKYAEATAALEGVLAEEPHNITALGALANTALALKDGGKLVAVAEKLVALEPLNRDAYLFLREGHRFAKDAKAANTVAERVLGMTASVNVSGLTLGPASADVAGTVTGFEGLDAKTGKPIPPKAATLAFELIDAAGKVIATQDVAVPALKKDEKHEFSFTAKGEGIAGYRYTVKN